MLHPHLPSGLGFRIPVAPNRQPQEMRMSTPRVPDTCLLAMQSLCHRNPGSYTATHRPFSRPRLHHVRVCPSQPNAPAHPILCLPSHCPTSDAVPGRPWLTRPTWEEHPADHARHDHQAHGQHLEVAGEDAARLGMVQVPGRQGPLHNDLQRP